jgi:hypothetical protein
VLNLADYGRIRVMADRLGIEAIDREGRLVVLKFRPQAKVDPVRLVALVRQRPELTLVPPAGLKFSLDGARAQGNLKPPALSPLRGGRTRSTAPPSWWVARAKDAEVKPGFNKADMTRAAKEDPRAPGGVFEQVGGLLSDLLDQR